MKFNNKLILSMVAFLLLFVNIITVAAAPSFQDGSINGTVTGLTCGTDESNNIVILVTVEADDGTSQTVALDPFNAEGLGLITLDEFDVPDCSDESLNGVLETNPIVSIDPSLVLYTEEEKQHPIGTILSLFFGDFADYETIMAAHDEGTGFGVIAQALWITMELGGDSDTFNTLIQAKKDHDFSNITLANGSTPRNWGDVVKSIKKGNNLGKVVSDKENKGNGPDKNNQNNKDNDHGKPENPGNPHNK